VHSGSDRTCATTSLRPARSTAMTSPADQSEKYNRSPFQRGDSTRPRPASSVRTLLISWPPFAPPARRRRLASYTNDHRPDRRSAAHAHDSPTRPAPEPPAQVLRTTCLISPEWVPLPVL